MACLPPYLDVGIKVSAPVSSRGPWAICNSIQSSLKGIPLLMIRLARVGARKQPHYRVVVIEKDRARNGRSVEVVGTYNPRTNPATVDLKRDRIDYWTAKGAQLSERVAKLVKSLPAAETAAA